MKYKNHIIVAILGIILFGSGFYAGQSRERDTCYGKLKYVIQYAVLLENENSKIYERCKE